MCKGTNIIFFIHLNKIPKGKKNVYCKLVASIRLLKEEKNRIRVTLGGDRLEYEGNKSTVPATLTTMKIHLNSIISTKESKYMTVDIKDFYYRMPMEIFQYGHLLFEQSFNNIT